MILKFKTQHQKIIEQQKKLTQWHRKWAWMPTCIETKDGIATWVWMSYYYQRVEATIDWRYGWKRTRRCYYLKVTARHYATDDFDLLVKTSNS